MNEALTKDTTSCLCTNFIKWNHWSFWQLSGRKQKPVM